MNKLLEHKRLTAVAGGLLLFIYLVLSNHFFGRTSVKLAGAVSGKASFDVYWDLGDGFQSYAKQRLTVGSDPAAPDDAQSEAGVPRADFSLNVALPQVDIAALKFVTAEGDPPTLERIEIEGPTEKAVLLSEPQVLDRDIVIDDLKVKRRFFHFGLFLLHCAMAVFGAWLLWLALSAKERLGAATWKEAFLGEGRGVFWFFFAVLFGSYGVWLVGWWPAAMTNDSWMTVAEVLSLELSDVHPYIYTIYIAAIWQLFRSVGGIALTHVLFTSLLLSSILYFAWRNRCPRILVGLMLIFYALSVPTALFSITIWKDIPFSIALVLVAYLLFRARFKRELGNDFLRVPAWSIPLLAIALLLLCGSRHNGLVFYFILPALFWGSLSRRDWLCFTGFMLSAFLVVNIAIPKVFGIQKFTTSAQHQLRTAFAVMTHPAYYSDDRARDIEILEEALGYSFDEVKERFPRNWFGLFDESLIRQRQFTPQAGNTEDYHGKFVARLALDNIPIVMGTRCYEFFHSLGIDSSHSDARNNNFENPMQLWGTNLRPPGQTLFGQSVRSQPPSLQLREWLKEIALAAMRFDGFFSMQVLIWNLLIPLGVMSLVLFIERGNSAISLFILPSLLTALFVFIAGAGESWRYFYYIYHCGMLTIPLYATYRRQKAAA